jgi:hypothetical protein
MDGMEKKGAGRECPTSCLRRPVVTNANFGDKLLTRLVKMRIL